MGNGQTPVKREASQLVKLLLEKHVQPLSIGDEFSNRVFDLVIEELDPNGFILTMEDIKRLRAYRDTIDDDISGKSWLFFPALTDTYKKALSRSLEFVVAATDVPVDVYAKISPLDTTRARSEFDHKSFWRLLLHHYIMADVAELRPANASTGEKEFLTKFEPLVRRKLRLRNQHMIQRTLNHPEGYDKYVASVFMRSISQAFDPHSTYLSMTEMENFISQLSTEGYFFGLGLDENDKGEIVITSLKPGGPAWKSGMIHNGDVVEKLRWKGGEWLDALGMDETELDAILQQSNHNILELMLRDVTNASHVVELKKEKISSDQNVVRGFVLNGARKIGYIYLPDFYSEWGETEGAKCANDVAREILKLKNEKIEGLILDVRYNGGGSLYEAIAMAGSFIDAGPMGILGDRKEVVTEKDFNRGTVWDGPLVIMVNKLSASAAEFLAAALQDYRRAIIVGSTTYGKATSQEMFSLVPGRAQIDYAKIGNELGAGYSTITTSRIYRITGKSLQNVGVIPDVKIEDPYDLLDYHESLLPYSIRQDSVNKKTYYTPMQPLPIRCLQERSVVRLNADSSFIALRSYLKSYKESGEPMTMDFKNLVDAASRRNRSLILFNKSEAAQMPDFQVQPTTSDQASVVDEYQNSLNSIWLKNISKDISLAEGFHIICDYIELLNH
jgi:carboxyl-terminal processing protease